MNAVGQLPLIVEAAVTSQLFGFMQSSIRITDQFIHTVTVLRINTDTGTGKHTEQMALQAVWPRNNLQQLIAFFLNTFLTIDTAEYNNKLITA